MTSADKMLQELGFEYVKTEQKPNSINEIWKSKEQGKIQIEDEKLPLDIYINFCYYYDYFTFTDYFCEGWYQKPNDRKNYVLLCPTQKLLNAANCKLIEFVNKTRDLIFK